MNYYEILNCKPDSSFEEIKRNYKRLAKLNHPDKQGSSDSEKFIKIDEAWKVLQHDASRKTYDASLLINSCAETPFIHAELTIKELDFDSDCKATYSCRCGGYFVIQKGDIDVDGEHIIECEECSNCILIKN